MGSALLVMDMQNGIVERIVDRSTLLIGAISSALAAARRADLPVIFVRVAFETVRPKSAPKTSLSPRSPTWTT